MSDNTSPRVGLFATCLVDLMRPVVGFAAVKLLEDAGCIVDVPSSQACCGQPAYNAGDTSDTIDIARQVITSFENYDYIVVPFGSCGGILKHHYIELFEGDSEWAHRAQGFADKTHELVSFLNDVMNVSLIGLKLNATVTYHDSCSGLRELKIKEQPRALLNTVDGLNLVEGNEAETWCGFGGLFCVKYSDVSEKMGDAKVDYIVATGADILVAGDLGYLMNIAGRLQRRNIDIKVRHTAEILANMMHGPAIGDPMDDA